MVSSSKILTVSYGTFSCTAEGFEDPLEVVKDATHFFRGVVREDRFFGAEPPQFDPELAAELLQSQISAEAGQGKLTLRSPFAGAGASSGAMSAALSAGRAPERSAADEVGELPAAAAETPASTPETTAPETTAPKTTATEAVAEMAAEPAPEEPKVAVSYQGDGSEDDLEEARRAEDTIASILADEAGDDSLAGEAALFGEADGGEIPAAPQPGVGLSDPESVAAKLRRIRAVVAQGGPADAEAEPEAEEAEASVSAMLEALEPARDETPSSVQALRDNLFTDTLASAAFEDGFEDDAEDEDDSALYEAPPEADAETDAETAEETTVESEAPAAEPKITPARPRARVVKVKRAAFDAAAGKGLIEDIAEASAAPAAPVSSLSPEDEDDLARELAAVRAELQDDFEDGWDAEDDLEDVAEAQDDDAVAEDVAAELGGDTELAAAVGAAMLNDDSDDSWEYDDEWDDEDEDATARGAETAAPLRLETSDAAPQEDWDEDGDSTLEFEFSDSFEDDEDAEDDTDLAAGGDADSAAEAEREEAQRRAAHEEVRKAVKMSSPARAMLTERRVEDNDASRILDETNTQLQEPEGNRRRSAIAHLRAAVAATRADKLLGRKRDAGEQAEPYREDLANVVRPRRPAAPAGHTERPAEIARPAPLKLVAEQRVDSETPAPRPRRVRLADIDETAALSAGEGDDSFAEYAESVGARDLPELLEAAAAYMSFVERREQFSRPQLMTKVRQVETEESSREDRLRSFGQLLREGKIEKTRGGRFTASERISFKPDARAAS
ncbi:hypothetical protein [Salipiger bermudensis]|uniref:Lipoprotein, putative n=1 Tax=Salipiger bermudensis (strain DSM 26914 / JCM 13377 / KCTC 12554 / HTCC2601) TaxID=314265 RepID=Q0FQQ9_SALBH|nr:lipoprotein, putative [Salipiger bermudensis HTCC2601]